MSSGTVSPTYYADFGGLEGLKKSVKADDPNALRQVARQFESLFTNMMLKSMREAKLGDGLGDSQETDLYQGMYDQQLSLQLSQGKGIGLADMLVQQLTRAAGGKAASTAPTAAAPAGAAARSGPATSNAQRTSFIKRIEPYAEQAAKQLGVSPDTLIAQAALETGWGRHLPGGAGASANLFGIKAGGSWSGATASAVTTEYQQGSATAVTQAFRGYDSVQAGMADYVNLLRTGSRYQGALGTGGDVAAFGSALSRGGYATDPDYVQKLEATAASVKALRAATPDAPADAAEPSLKFAGSPPTTSGGESA